MKLSSLTICNYKNYYGKQYFSFHVTENKNIILVGGENGAGKTTLFGSILLCLYGHQFSGKPLSKSSYEAYIRACQNHIAVDNGDNSYFIESVTGWTLRLSRKKIGNSISMIFSPPIQVDTFSLMGKR